MFTQNHVDIHGDDLSRSLTFQNGFFVRPFSWEICSVVSGVTPTAKLIVSSCISADFSVVTVTVLMACLIALWVLLAASTMSSPPCANFSVVASPVLMAPSAACFSSCLMAMQVLLAASTILPPACSNFSVVAAPVLITSPTACFSSCLMAMWVLFPASNAPLIELTVDRCLMGGNER